MNSQNRAVVGTLAEVLGTRPTVTLYGLDGTAIAGLYANSELQSINVRVVNSSHITIGYDANPAAVHSSGDYLEGDFEIMPMGTNLAGAKTESIVLEPMMQIGFVGMPVIKFGPWTDGLNVGGSGIQLRRWIHLGGDSITLRPGQPSPKTIKLHRFQNITGGAVIAS